MKKNGQVCTFRHVAGQQLLFGLRPDQLAQPSSVSFIYLKNFFNSQFLAR